MNGHSPRAATHALAFMSAETFAEATPTQPSSTGSPV